MYSKTNEKCPEKEGGLSNRTLKRGKQERRGEHGDFRFWSTAPRRYARSAETMRQKAVGEIQLRRGRGAFFFFLFSFFLR